MSGKCKKRSLSREQRFRRGWKRATIFLSLFVVFGTISFLVLPAVTMNQDNCEIAEHQHTEACVAQEGGEITCQIPEHTHGEECKKLVSLTEEEQELAAEDDTEVSEEVPEEVPVDVVTEDEKKETKESEKPTDNKEVEDGIQFVADDYTTTVIADSDAKLPKDTVVAARPLFDSNEPVAAAFSLNSESTQDDGSVYVDDIIQTVTWGEVTRIKLYDISLISDDKEVQPSAPVEVRTEFAEPIAIGKEEVLYGVHIGEDGPEILPANTERDENGNIIAVNHTQAGFSPSGYVLVHVSNPTDKGPDILPVHYCIWVNDQWIIAGSSRTGWYGNYTSLQDETSDERDYITVEQIGSILSDYGLNTTDNEEIRQTVWYQRAEEAGKTIYRDTGVTTKEINGQEEKVFELSRNMVKDDGYHIYYVPHGTVRGADTYPSNRDLGADLKQESKFYTMTVRDMNNIVYQAGEELPATQVIAYGDPVSVTVKANLDDAGNPRGWQWVNDKGNVVHGIDRIYDMNGDGYFDPDTEVDDRFGYSYDETSKMATYTFDGILGRTTLIPYSEAVGGSQQSTDKQVDIVVHLDGKWQKVGQLNLMYKQDGMCVNDEDEPLWFVTAGQIYTILKDFGFNPGSYSPDDFANTGHAFTHAKGLFTTADQMTMEADGVNQVMTNNGTTVALGLGTEAEGNQFTLFYLPGSTKEKYEDVHLVNAKEYADDEVLIENDRFYSVKVVDDYQLVYYGYETDNFKVYVQEGDAVDIKVQNALSVLWSVPGYDNISATQEGNFNVYHFENVQKPIVIEASSLNPSFTVQYYANIERYELYDTGNGDVKVDGRIPLIDTTGGTLPSNNRTTTDTADLKYLQLTEVVRKLTDQNAGTPTQLYKVNTYVDNAEIYREQKYIYETSHQWRNIDKLWQNDGYVIEDVWILKDGMDPKSTDEDDWWIYKSDTNGANISFTNLASEESAPKDENNNVQEGGDYKILVTEGMIMRLHYELKESTYTDDKAKFFDYDISSDGKNVGQQGINSHASGKTNTANYYAFGNNNCRTGMGNASWNGAYLNKTNKNKIYGGCSFGLVTGWDKEQNNVIWAEGINAPNIFGGEGATGRTDYEGTLDFYRKGDVYTLSGSSVANGSRDNLNYFFNPSPTTTTTYSNIFTNNFWALDGATTKKDPLWGAWNSRGVVNGYNDAGAGDNSRGGAFTNYTLPPSDDGRAHNWFFGMNFSLSFNLSEDYIGPLEYIFFGDDDMWVFLEKADGTSELICDIGGVHSAVGEYVNLRDYLPVGAEGTTGTHTLRFYYTERGASGSTCWMSFTLPSVTSTTVEEGTAELRIQKELQNAAEEKIQNEEEYEFVVNLYRDHTKTEIINRPFSVQIDRANGETDYFATESGKSIFIGGGDKAKILGLPIGSYYVIQEMPDDRFWVEANGKEGYVVEGYVVEGTTQEGANIASFVNTLKGYTLPETGGSGTLPYIFSGITLMGGALLIYKKRRRLI